MSTWEKYNTVYTDDYDEIFDDTTEESGATELEAQIMCDNFYESLEETREAIARDVTFYRMLKDGMDHDDAYTYAYSGSNYDDYDDITEEEIEAVMLENAIGELIYE